MIAQGLLGARWHCYLALKSRYYTTFWGNNQKINT